MIIHNNSYKRINWYKLMYTSMVDHCQVLDCLIIIHQIFHSFETDASWLVSLLKSLLLLKWLIYENDYVTFCKKMSKKKMLMIYKRLCNPERTVTFTDLDKNYLLKKILRWFQVLTILGVSTMFIFMEFQDLSNERAY